jgi:O-methyltransferase
MPAVMSVRTSLSAFINKRLSHLGYAFVRTDGGRNSPYFASHHGAHYAYEPILIADALAPWATDDGFLAVWEKVRHNTLVDIFRCYELYQTVRQIAPVFGDIVEVGVWRGGTGAVLASAASRWKGDARVWLCDTFAGVVKAGSFDSAYRGGEHADASDTAVENLLRAMGLENTSVLKGIFPDDTAAAIAGRQIALLHVDVDAYQSAADVVAWAAPYMASGAVIIFDDYGFSTCKGITRFVDELRADGQWLWFYNLNGHAILIKK